MAISVGPAQFESFRSLLRAVYPDPRVDITNMLVETTIRALPEEVQESLFGEVIGAVTGLPIPEEESAEVLGYYLARATHERHGVHRFTATLPMVRVRLPETRQDVATRIGIVYAGDHKLHSREKFVFHYDGHLDFAVGDIELLTPARYFGARFGAIATYLVKDKNGKLAAYVLEAGMATGEPVVIYLAPELGPIMRRSWYTPTPFSSDTHIYEGLARAEDDGEPRSLEVQVRTEKGAAPHLTATVEYERVENPPTVWPALLTAEAAIRVATIAERLGKPVPGAEWAVPVLAKFGRTLDWEKKP